MNKLGVIVKRSIDILKTEGLKNLLSHSLDYLATKLFKREYFYVYQHTIKVREGSQYMPKLNDFDFRIVSSNAEADILAKEMGDDFRSRIIRASERLNKGAVAFVVYIQREFAYIGWAALTEEAKYAIDPRPCKADFANKQAYTGGSFTSPRYRGKGLMTYVYFRIFEFLRHQGITASKNIVSVHNLASQKVHAKFNPKICARARYTKILWWQFWKEFPINSD
jgi:hypothetical protein